LIEQLKAFEEQVLDENLSFLCENNKYFLDIQQCKNIFLLVKIKEGRKYLKDLFQSGLRIRNHS
jgi:hypothetical protein